MMIDHIHVWIVIILSRLILGNRALVYFDKCTSLIIDVYKVTLRYICRFLISLVN